jgi:hypothetical protein
MDLNRSNFTLSTPHPWSIYPGPTGGNFYAFKFGAIHGTTDKSCFVFSKQRPNLCFHALKHGTQICIPDTSLGTSLVLKIIKIVSMRMLDYKKKAMPNQCIR